MDLKAKLNSGEDANKNGRVVKTIMGEEKNWMKFVSFTAHGVKGVRRGGRRREI